MFYSTSVRYVHSVETGSKRKDPVMAFALTISFVLVLSSAYLFHQWYTGDFLDPSL